MPTSNSAIPVNVTTVWRSRIDWHSVSRGQLQDVLPEGPLNRENQPALADEVYSAVVLPSAL
jgi:hypothetical protein